MSWISDLAGRAENILNKIDQNAASVLKSETENNDDATSKESKTTPAEESIVDGLRRNLSSSSLSLTKTLSPKKLLRGMDLQGALQQRVQQQQQQQSFSSEETMSQKAENTNSRLSSRRSSLSSKTDGTVIECELASVESSDVIIKQRQQTDHNSTEKDLTDLRMTLAEITAERNELKDEIAQLQNEVKEATGLLRIQELENSVAELNHERGHLSNEIAGMKQNCMEYVKSITELETNLSKARQTILDLSEKLDWQTKEAKQHTVEFEQYRKKAQTTLQMKDKIIAELRQKQNDGIVGTDGGSDVEGAIIVAGGSGGRRMDGTLESDTEKILQMKISELRQENTNLSDELRLLHIQLEESKRTMQLFEQKLTENLIERNKNEELLREEQQKTIQFESDLKILNQELLAVREEMHNQRQSFSIKLHEKENEIVRLQSKQLEIQGYSNANVLEDRIESLTQALVQKQSAIEMVTAERNALKLQLEKTDDKIRQLVAQNKANPVQIINLNDTDDAKAQLPYLMRENPFDTNVTRRVKRAYSSLDSAGIRVGVFLRRYPLVRIMVFIYVALLHLWVMFVLLSSTPS